MGFRLAYLDTTSTDFNGQLGRWNGAAPNILDFLFNIDIKIGDRSECYTMRVEENRQRSDEHESFTGDRNG